MYHSARVTAPGRLPPAPGHLRSLFTPPGPLLRADYRPLQVISGARSLRPGHCSGQTAARSGSSPELVHSCWFGCSIWISGRPAVAASCCLCAGSTVPLVSAPSSLSESPRAPATVFGMADTLWGVGVGVRVCLPAAVSRRDILPPSSRCHRNDATPSDTVPSGGGLSAPSSCVRKTESCPSFGSIVAH